MQTNIYIDLTRAFNRGKIRAVICSGQAVVLHRLALMSKDGDWVIREDEESLQYIMRVLASFQARYRFGAPLDIRWMKGGWSSHFDFRINSIRVRTDFFTRPPRISPSELKRLWKEQESSDLPFVNLRDLAELKKTNREKDYVVIGEIARLMKDPRDQLLYSRSARDIINLASKYPHLVMELKKKRPLLANFSEGREKLEEMLDAEKRAMIHANEKRLSLYLKAAEKWTALWPTVEKEISGMPLFDAHQQIISRAEEVLPFSPKEKEINHG
ncbi:MAG: hypothetical protein GTO45_09360 [Candidatus Aminicenantes bacterium]|nr:hypothetical protein [Candidatus Aminicenantes bacterium]NIM84271.1 hypothetical protein [Candidatus Aminicenantes bacterium]NIN18300.1 hypothetical protein [Candidatus Aminicenantes bacterium]NIN47471.1 hypothetical protein [Candidatus Aminicenantes bacterium]NIN84953.1 hypothetical protein [Candidatus Aminicenantes bacterium]